MTDLTAGHAAQLRQVLAVACTQAGLTTNTEAAELLKYSNNAVFQLAEQPVVVRIGIGDTGRARGPRIVKMARWLETHHAPTVRLRNDIDQPMHIDDAHTVTFWHALRQPTPPQPWRAADLAAPLRVLHHLPIDHDTLSHWEPFAAADRRLADADPALPAEDLDWLRAQWAQAAEDYRRLPPLRMGIVHGDAHTGNLLYHHTTPILADLDSTGIGPISWDLAVPAVASERFDKARVDFNTEFVTAYGLDVTTLPEWPVLRRIRELLLVTSAIPDLANRPTIAAEHAHRLRTLREGRTDTLWHRYQ